MTATAHAHTTHLVVTETKVAKRRGMIGREGSHFSQLVCACMENLQREEG